METEMRAGSSGAEQNTLQQKQRESKKSNHNSASAQMQLYVPAVRVWRCHGLAWHVETGAAGTPAPSTGGGGY